MAADDKKNNPPVKIVKVQPYPIDCNFDTIEGQPPLAAQIIRLELVGFVFRSVGHLYRIGEEYTCHFEIPVLKQKISEVVKVVKSSESSEAYVPKGTKERVMTVEVHFKNQMGEFRKPIAQFIAKIGQKSLAASLALNNAVNKAAGSGGNKSGK